MKRAILVGGIVVVALAAFGGVRWFQDAREEADDPGTTLPLLGIPNEPDDGTVPDAVASLDYLVGAGDDPYESTYCSEATRGSIRAAAEAEIGDRERVDSVYCTSLPGVVGIIRSDGSRYALTVSIDKDGAWRFTRSNR